MRGTLPEETTKAARRDPETGADGVSHRLLVVLDRSAAADGARELARHWSGSFGAETRFVTIEEGSARRVRDGAASLATADGSARLRAGGHTLGARNRTLVSGIAAAAEDFGADLIVLGCDHRRLARHRVGASLRERLARATELPVIVAPVRTAQADDGPDHAEVGGAVRHRVGPRGFARV